MAVEERAPQEAIENVTEDPAIGPDEKETTINFLKQEEGARLFTSEAGLIRRVMSHPEIPIVAFVVEEGNQRPQVTPEDYQGQPIVGVRASLPVSLLKIRLKPRNNTQHARIVSKQALQEQEATR